MGGRLGEDLLMEILSQAYDFDHIILPLQDRLLTEGVAIPGWRDGEGRERSAFTASVLRALVELRLGIPERDLQAVAAEAASRMLGLGVLDPLLRTEGVEEIIVRDGFVQVERYGRIEDVGALASDEYFRQLARRVAEFGGRPLGAASPFVLVDLPDGSRFTAMIPPLGESTNINIRVFAKRKLSLEDMVNLGSLDERTAGFLARVASSMAASVLISGRPGAGKTTLLNALSFHFPREAQICLVETFKELQLQHPHLARAVVKVGEREEGTVSMREVVNVLYTRMRPDILVVGEVVDDEAVEFLHAINLGITALTTIHGNSALDALHRLESIVLENKATLNWVPTRERIARGIDLVVHLDRTLDGRRYVAEVVGLEGLDEHNRYQVEILTGKAGTGLGVMKQQMRGLWRGEGRKEG